MSLFIFSIKRSSCDLLHLAGLKRCQAAVECFLLLYFSVNWKCSLPSFGMARVRNCFKSGKNPLHSKWFMINQLQISFCEMTNPLQFLCTDLDHCVAGRYQTQLCTENLWPRNYRYSTLLKIAFSPLIAEFWHFSVCVLVNYFLMELKGSKLFITSYLLSTFAKSFFDKYWELEGQGFLSE